MNRIPLGEIVSIDPTALSFISNWKHANINKYKNPMELHGIEEKFKRFAVSQIPPTYFQTQLAEFKDHQHGNILKDKIQILLDNDNKEEKISSSINMTLYSDQYNSIETSSQRSDFACAILRAAAEARHPITRAYKYECLYINANQIADWKFHSIKKKKLFELDFLFIDDFDNMLNGQSVSVDYSTFIQELLSSRYKNSFQSTFISINNFDKGGIHKSDKELEASFRANLNPQKRNISNSYIIKLVSEHTKDLLLKF